MSIVLFLYSIGVIGLQGGSKCTNQPCIGRRVNFYVQYRSIGPCDFARYRILQGKKMDGSKSHAELQLLKHIKAIG
jgi:hypothetical protein